MFDEMKVHRIPTVQGPAFVMDSVLEEGTLAWIDAFRLKLALNAKRPTVDRRFFADGPLVMDEILKSGYNPAIPYAPQRPLAELLERAIHRAISPASQNVKEQFDDGASTKNDDNKPCHVFRYQRFLEYTKNGLKLEPHTDGTKVCDDTGYVSTHTMLLYMTDCSQGGETVLLKECLKAWPDTQDDNNDESALIYATRPRRGRILLFPHATPHAGAMVVSLPKICLRAEVYLSKQVQVTS